ncbi:MAG: oligosaccharide flippase family protein, partial [Wenzhouxiangellaceae bacterium]
MSKPSSFFRRGSLVMAAIAIAGFGADYLLNLGLTRLLSNHEYGDYKVAHAFATLAGAVVLLGGDRAAPKALAGPLTRHESAPVWEYLWFYFRIALGLSAAIAAITWVGSFYHVGHADPTDHHPIAWVVVGIPILAAGALVSRTLQSGHHLVLANSPWRVAFPLTKLALIAVAAWMLGEMNVEGAIVLSLAAATLVVAWQWWKLRRLELSDFKRAPDIASPRAWLSVSLPMMGAFLIALALAQSDLYFLEILGEEDEVGRYAAAATTAHFLIILQAAIAGLFTPALQPALDQGLDAARVVYRQGQRLMLTWLIPVTVLLAVAARPALALFGPEYPTVTTELRLLLLGYAAWALAAMASMWLQYTGRGRSVLGISLLLLLVDSGLNFILIPRFGVMGAAA